MVAKGKADFTRPNMRIDVRWVLDGLLEDARISERDAQFVAGYRREKDELNWNPLQLIAKHNLQDQHQEEQGKLTLPVLYLMEDATEAQRTQLNKLILRQEPIDLNVVAGIANYAGAVCRAVATAKGMLEEARTALLILPENDYSTALSGITHYLDSLLDKCRPA